MTTYVICPGDGTLRTDSSGNWWYCSTGLATRSSSETVALLRAEGAISETIQTPNQPVFGFLPPLTIDEGVALSTEVLLLFTVVAIYRYLRKTFK